MLTLSTLVTGCVAFLFMLQAVPAAAQGTFGTLPVKVRLGEKIIVQDAQGAVTEGTIQEVSDSTLVVNYYRGPVTDPSLKTTRTFTPDEVRRVLKRGHIWDGAIKGALVGLIPAGIFAAAECYDCGEGSFTLFTVSVGAAIGVGIDALFGPKTLYRRDTARSRVALAPIINRHARGVSASIRF
jgi:hypothetical protein